MFQMSFKQYPKDKGKMLAEIRRAFDAYDEDEIDDDIFLPLLHHYEEYSREERWLGQYHSRIDGDEIRDEFEANKSTLDRLGKKRTRRLEKILSH